MKTLSELMQQHLPDTGIAVSGGAELHMEVVDTNTGTIWMSLDVVTQDDFDSLELPEGFDRVGIGAASMDSALFRYSPNAEGEAVRERTISGHRFINVATPIAMTNLDCGMLEILVNKAHVIGFEAGRSVTIMNTREGDFVELVGDSAFDHELSLPKGATLRQVELTAPWVISLPTPTKTYFQFDCDVRSFQGPVTAP